MCAESSSSEGRIRLPPPSRRYSAISVMVLTLEAASRPSSCSMATRSSRRRSKNSRPVSIASVLNALRFSYPCCAGPSAMRRLPVRMRRPRQCCALIRAVVRKLQIHAQILAPQQSDNRLQLVAVLTGHSHSIALNAGLSLLFRVLHQANNLLGLFNRDAHLQFDLLPHALARRLLQLFVSQVLQRYP